MNNELINVDYYKKVYYKSLLPLDKINDFLKLFDESETDRVSRNLISLLNLSVTGSLLLNFTSTDEKTQFLRLCQDDFQNPKILDFLIKKFPDIEHNILENIERTILSTEKFISE